MRMDDYINSEFLSVLKELQIPVIVKGNSAELKEHDSLRITLSGKYKDYWKRWSTGAQGYGVSDLLSYLVSEGTVDPERANPYITGNYSVKGEKVKVKKVQPTNFNQMVTDPQNEDIIRYLVDERKLSPLLIDKLVNNKLIVKDGRGNIRFMRYNPSGFWIGGDVQGIKPMISTDSEGNTVVSRPIKLSLPGSKGLFHILEKETDYSTVKTLYLTEAAIDMISFIELASVKDREENNYALPEIKGVGDMYISMSGAGKIEYTLLELRDQYKVSLENLEEIVVATDNDEAGDSALKALKKLANSYGVKGKITRLLPNGGNPYFDRKQSEMTTIKDWNDLLKLTK